MLDFLGMIITEVDSASAIQSGMEVVEGLIVMVVGWGGPAGTAGIETGDIISKVDGKPIKRLEEMEDCLSSHRPQTRIVFQLQRAGMWCFVEIPFAENFIGGIHRINSRSCRISRIRSLGT
ncbi:PDZ domain-containing protein [Geobacter sp. AOG2]|uniref:PDZ domain-containing protein n=1 Tax=Geobacter sp. AOG2 TaxID=1566347 RepID=UPI001CC58B08|nr:PDZ domain-containing protein [Geobacter sp. AOG2]